MSLTKPVSERGRTIRGSRGRCFISARAGVDLRTIRRVLADTDYAATALDDLAEAGQPVQDAVRDAISRSDLFLAVLDTDPPDANVLFELGYASALRKRTLALIDPRIEARPLDLASVAEVRATPQDDQAIAFAVEQAIAAPKPSKPRPRPSGERSRPIGETADRLLARLDRMESASYEHELQHLVVSALEESGVAAVATSPSLDHRADMAVWADDLAAFTSNPLLIELKPRLPSAEAAKQAVQRFDPFLTQSGSAWGLLLYGETAVDPNALQEIRGSRVLVCSIRDLIEQLRGKGFAEVVRELRNERVHRLD
jgi:hypothetical protein